MKRIFAFIVVLVMAVSMAGCSDAAKEALNKDLSRGVVDGNTYTSEYIGFSFVKPDSWVYSTDEEINELKKREQAPIFSISLTMKLQLQT